MQEVVIGVEGGTDGAEAENEAGDGWQQKSCPDAALGGTGVGEVDLQGILLCMAGKAFFHMAGTCIPRGPYLLPKGFGFGVDDDVLFCIGRCGDVFVG